MALVVVNKNGVRASQKLFNFMNDSFFSQQNIISTIYVNYLVIQSISKNKIGC